MYMIRIFSTVGNILYLIILFSSYLQLKRKKEINKQLINVNLFLIALMLANFVTAWR